MSMAITQDLPGILRHSTLALYRRALVLGGGGGAGAGPGGGLGALGRALVAGLLGPGHERYLLRDTDTTEVLSDRGSKAKSETKDTYGLWWLPRDGGCQVVHETLRRGEDHHGVYPA